MGYIYRHGVREPLRWIALAVFQPARFRVAYEPIGLGQRLGMLARLIVPLYLFSFVLVTLVRAIPLSVYLLALADEAHQLHVSHWLVSAVGVAFGLLLGLVFGSVRGVSFGIVISLTAGVVFGLPGIYAVLHTDVLGAWLLPTLALAAGLALSLSFGLTWGLAFGIIVGLAAAIGIAGLDLVADLVIGLGFGLALNLRGDSLAFLARLQISLVVGIILGVLAGITAGPSGGIASGLIAGVGSLLGLSAGDYFATARRTISRLSL